MSIDKRPPVARVPAISLSAVVTNFCEPVQLRVTVPPLLAICKVLIIPRPPLIVSPIKVPEPLNCWLKLPPSNVLPVKLSTVLAAARLAVPFNAKLPPKFIV